MSPTSPISSELANGLYPPVIDEQIINTALIIFLNAISIECDGVEAEWSLHRKSFKFGQHFEAETDGHLSIFDRKGSLSRAIVEVKRNLRENQPQIIYQETAEMAAWIFEEPDKENKYIYRRVLVSQNHMEIYLTIAEYDNGYVKYLRGENDEKDEISLMKMNQFGPWLLKCQDHFLLVSK
ncbi:hypothetical protein BDBG_08371 [Blastomyces gilchristii SLH14081]|uniref:Fungal-type protein kinase domain-containing protein n=1 Tax=Blastomyces gilchristii (strain SLH14081) TaxID=559298 RepID=A0A179UYE1_BLAGS|nr:uncharacterized protein BDBG_08371 [Blastomyces gilchristii SLH14081]OAT13104.1 hypothetical protein BDBG_08371 [Blastomyces gilchristii SLH14081]